MAVQLSLTPLDAQTLLDVDTLDAFVSGKMTEEIIQINQEIYKGDTIIVDEIPFAINNVDGALFLHPYQVNIGSKSLFRYSFIAYRPHENDLLWFFKGMSKTKDRKEAYYIYNALSDYCSKLEQEIIPLIYRNKR